MGKKGFRIIGTSFLAVLGAALVVWVGTSIFKTTADILASSAPLNLAEARQERCPIELPEDANNIRFAAYAEWQAYEVYVKFEAPLASCKAHAIYLLEKYNNQAFVHPVPAELSVLDTPVEPVEPGPPLDVKWLDVHAITNGFCGGERGGISPSFGLTPTAISLTTRTRTESIG